MSDDRYTDQTPGGLGTALADLASSVGDDPDRLASVQARVRRLRTRRRVRRTAVIGGVAVATVASLAVLVRPHGEPAVTSAGRSATSVSEPAPGLPACRVALANPGAVTHEGVKGLGSIVAVTDQSVTLHVDSPRPDQPSELTAVVTAGTEWVDAGGTAGRPALAAGDRVAFAVEPTESGYRLLVLETRPIDGADPTAGTTDTTATVVKDAATDTAANGSMDAVKAAAIDAVKAAGVAPPSTDPIKAGATITTVAPGALTFHIDEGSLAGQDVTATTGPDTTYVAGNTKCTGADLAAGDQVTVLLQPAAGGGYSAESVGLLA